MFASAFIRSLPIFRRSAAAAPGALVLAALLAGPLLRAEDKKETARLTALVPLEVTPGAEVTLKFRGLKLDTATEIHFPGHPDLKAELKEKKKADLPNGLEAKDVGDTQCEATVKIPAEVAPGPLAVELATPTGPLASSVRVLAAASCVAEKEPNNGFHEAQPLEPGKVLRGSINQEKDVDVYNLEAHHGHQLEIEVLAARATSLLDPLATIFDAHGRVLAVVDDSEGRDPVLHFDPPADGRYFLTIQDAGDRGGPWHAYELTVKEAAAP